MTSVKSADCGDGPSAIGADEMPMWRVTGELLCEPITARFRAETKDEAVKHAHDRGITVATCEIIEPRHAGAARR